MIKSFRHKGLRKLWHEGKAAARRLGVSRQALHAVLSGKTGLSAEMAIRVWHLFGSPPSHWLAIQAAHDLWHVERRGAAEFDRIEKVA